MIQETVKRLLAPVPRYFRILQVMMGSIGGGSIAALNYSDNLPEGMKLWFHYGVAIGAAGVFLAQLTIQDKSQIK
jgi:hypothetical protein